MAFFAGLVETEDGVPVAAVHIGGESFYVIDDQGFRRHVDAQPIDRSVLAQFLEQLQEHPDVGGVAGILRRHRRAQLCLEVLLDPGPAQELAAAIQQAAALSQQAAPTFG